MRYEHWLRAARPSPWPGAVLCLSCDVRWTATALGTGREYANLASWHVQLCTRHGDSYAVSRTASGTTAESFWAVVKTATLRGRNVWIISTEFRAVAAVLELWDRLESGHVRISGKDHRTARRKDDVLPVRASSAGNTPQPLAEVGGIPRAQQLPAPLAEAQGHGGPRARMQRRGVSGVCVLEDPPIVLELMGDGWGGKVTWVDAANYGVSIPGAGNTLVQASTAMAFWFIHAASTLHSLGKCGWQATAGSQAMHLYRSVYHATPTLCHTEPRATALERGGLFGGRCEPFRLGKVDGGCHLFDFRAMYPYLYTTTMVPVRLVGVYPTADVATIRDAAPGQWWIAKVDIQTDEPEYPYRAGSTVIYPVGRFTTTLCGAALTGAIASGCVRRIRRLATYESDYALKGYAEGLYQVRCASERLADKPISGWVKRLMNCLHGKFAQTSCFWEDVPGAECPWKLAEWYHRLKSGEFQRRRVIGDRITKEIRGGFAHGTVPAIAAAIASAGRDRLLSAVICAGWQHVYYVDTDAIIMDDTGRDSLIAAGWVRPGEWGYLQHVISATSCDIGGVKRYRIGGRTVEAGRHRPDGTPDGTGGNQATIPGVRERLIRQLPPADWREAHPWQPGPGRYEARRSPGGWVWRVELNEWEDE